MAASSTSSSRPLCVAVIAHSRETLDGLQAYLQAAGVSSRAARTLHEVAVISSATRAVVLFPDELDARAVLARVTALKAERPGLLLVIVTSHPVRVREMLDPDGPPPAPVVLPKPAFGWTILDAIREHAGSEPA